MKILLVEEDERTATVIADALTAHHYLVNTTKDAQTGLALTKTYSYDLILLDVIFPELDSLSLCRRLRLEGAQMPILMLTGKSKSGDRIAGLEAGADDSMVKPFTIEELVARIRALLRRRSATRQTAITWENLQIDLDTCEVIYNNVPLHLTPKEYGLLELFLRNPRKIFSRSALLDSIWKTNEFPEERAVTTQIKGLRQKLKAAGMTADCLETVYGLGYRLKPEPAKVLEQREETHHSSSQQEEVEAAIEKVWQKLKATFSKTFALFDQICTQAIAPHPASGAMTLDPELLENAILEAHRLAGNLGVFGLPEGSELARNIERLLQDNAEPSQHEAQQLCEWVAALKQVVTQQRNGQKHQPQPEVHQHSPHHPIQRFNPKITLPL
jgi:DNA-binding response OmpR family regulator/HPt (histidine-containing phosphotransfer) domain-containing protein